MGKLGPKKYDEALYEQEFWARVDRTEDSCWLWQGYEDKKGYGRLGGARGRGVSVMAHRNAWEYLRGAILEGMTLDHLCRVKLCCNPDHLEVVTFEENTRRAGEWRRAQETHCKHGHEWTEANTIWRKRGGRICRVCKNLRSAKSAQKKAQQAALP